MAHQPAESNFFEYGTKYSGQLAKSEGPFSASDHDPVLVAIQYPQPPAGVLSLESAAANVEEGNTLSLSVSRSDGSHGEASVSYRIVYGSGDTSDVAPSPAPCTGPPGRASPRPSAFR